MTSPRTSQRPQSQPSGKREINVSPEQLKRVKGFQRMAAGAIFLLIPTIEIYRRLYKDGDRKIQEGEYNPQTGVIRKYSEEEKMKHFKESWLTKIFGEK